MTELTPVLKQRFFDADGIPLVGGKLYSYLAGTSTPHPTYTDSTGLVENTNPVVLDAEGYAAVWMADLAYKFVLTDSADVMIFTVDDVIPPNVISEGYLPYSYPTKFSFSLSASNYILSGESWDGATYSSIRYEYEIQQGSTIFTNGVFYLQYINGTWRLIVSDSADDGTQNGVTFSVSQTLTTGQLRLSESGISNGTVSFKKSWYLQFP